MTSLHQPAEGEPIDEAEALRRLADTTDPSGQYYAAWWLGKQRSTHPEAIVLLRAALRLRCERQHGSGVDENAVARNAIRALGKLGSAAQGALNDLVAIVDDPDYGLREASARALGELKVLEAVEPLLSRLRSGPETAGRLEPGLPQLAEPCEAMLEALGDIGCASTPVLSVLKLYVEHPWPVVSSAACRALLQLTQDDRWGHRLLALLQHPQLQVRRAVLMDLGATGWQPAAGPIAATLAENSLKLVALKGLVEASAPGSADREMLDLMDSLL